jgi:hypothetical protein
VVTHVTGSRPTGDGKKWGDAWQSAHWAHALGRGAWFVWADLPPDLQEGARRVVAHEADRIAGTEPPHQLRADTKAEENAWNSQILSVAMLLLPGDPRHTTWQSAYQKWVISSFLRPSDEHNPAVIDGRAVGDQFTGANIFDDFTLENHNFVHPDYMTTFSLSLGCMPDFVMTGRKAPDALLFNVAPIYENLKWMLLPDGSFVYPNGQDWELFRTPAWIGKHVLMAVWGHDPDAWHWAGQCVETAEKMQARSTNGAVFYPGEYFFPSTQPDLLRSLATSWLSLQLAGSIPNAPRDLLGIRRWDSAKIILRRTPEALHTVSWGARVMAQCVPRSLDRVVSPHERNGIGYIRLAGSKKELPLQVQLVDVSEGTNRFEVRLKVDHGKFFQAQLGFRSEPDGTFIVSEKLVALTDATTEEIATGLIGVLNNAHWIHERGRRQVFVDGVVNEIKSGSGRTWTWDKANRVGVGDVLDVISAKPLRVVYQSSARAQRGRITDLLYLNYLGGKRVWTGGQTISEYRVVLRSGP